VAAENGESGCWGSGCDEGGDAADGTSAQGEVSCSSTEAGGSGGWDTSDCGISSNSSSNESEGCDGGGAVVLEDGGEEGNGADVSEVVSE
jgi:hypothetical protein